MKIFRNIISIPAGWIIGSIINMSLVMLGHQVFPLEGIDVNDMEAFKAIAPTLGNEYFVFPFLAHALGTLVGAFVAGIIAKTHKSKFALGVGLLFLIGGIFMVVMVSGPTWFIVLDLLVAYLPMAWLGGKIATKLAK